VPLIRQPVRVTALPGETPTSPVIVEAVHVMAVPARRAKAGAEFCATSAAAERPETVMARAAIAASCVRRAEEQGIFMWANVARKIFAGCPVVHTGGF
jgi:hypothetical protein